MSLITPSSETDTDKCYQFEFIEYSHGLFDTQYDESIEATYIIHLEGNGRLEQVKAQLEMFQPTQKIYLLHNQGYKKCEKSPEIDKPHLDLTDAFLKVFRHAQERGYGNILVLEDDFEFDTKILQPEHRNEVARFLTEHRNEDFLYMLGCIPLIMIPIDIHVKHYLLGNSGGTHAVVYSQKLRDRVLKTDVKQMKDWDVYHNYHSKRYAYYTPLCYQLFPETHNQQHWGVEHWYLRPLVPISLWIFKFVRLDTQTEPGYSLFYFFGKAVVWFLLIMAVGLLVWVIRPLFSAGFRGWWKKEGKREKGEEGKGK